MTEAPTDYEPDFADTGFPNYDISPDGQQFVMVARTSEIAEESAQIVFVLNWFEELKARVPTGR